MESTLNSDVSLIADFNGDCIPEIMVSGIISLDDRIIDTFRLHFYDSKSGIIKHKYDCFDFAGENITPVIAALDNDETLDIVYSSYEGTPLPGGLIMCNDYNGNLKWVSDKFFLKY